MFKLADRAEWAAAYIPKEWKGEFGLAVLALFKDEEHFSLLCWEQGQWYLHFVQEMGLEVECHLWEACDTLPFAANMSPLFDQQEIRIHKEDFIERVKEAWKLGQRLTWEEGEPEFLKPFLHLQPKEKGLLDKLLEAL